MKNLQKAGRMAWRVMALSLVAYAAQAQVGIGTTAPQERLHVYDGSLLITTPEIKAEEDPFYDPAIPSPLEYGLYFKHDKCSFRAVGGRIGYSILDPTLFGQFSFATGYETLASGNSAAAFGQRSGASGVGAFAGGYGSNATGHYSFAFGYSALADGGYTVALGQSVSTNNKTGAFVFGDNSNVSTKNDANNQMMMRFAGGYKLYANSAGNIGVELPANGNSWSVLSDVRRKENFAPVNGEDFLQKISRMNLTSWNYKGQDPKQFRHYGPMAQDFYKAFGQDAFGTIGTDTTINQADFDGVNLIAIQALVKRTELLERQNAHLLAEMAKVKAQLAAREPRGKARRKKELAFVR